MTMGGFTSFSEVMEALQTLSISLQRGISFDPGFRDKPWSATNILRTTDGHEVPLMSKLHLKDGPSHVGTQVLLRLK